MSILDACSYDGFFDLLTSHNPYPNKSKGHSNDWRASKSFKSRKSRSNRRKSMRKHK